VGHGSSEGKRVYIDNVDHYVDDVIHHGMDIQDKHPNLPVFLVGHSMGGMIAVRSVLRHPGFFKGMVLNGPLIVVGPQVH
jgi:acylglycerol lipase